MRRTLGAVAGAAAVLLPVGTAAAAGIAKTKPKHKVVRKHEVASHKPRKRVVRAKKTVAGVEGSAGRWGFVQVTLIVRKTTTIVGKHKTVKRRVVGLRVPVYPDHTYRSIFINQRALPMLEQETLQARYTTNIDLIGGATYTSQAFLESLQSALLKVRSA